MPWSKQWPRVERRTGWMADDLGELILIVARVYWFEVWKGHEYEQIIRNIERQSRIVCTVCETIRSDQRCLG